MINVNKIISVYELLGLIKDFKAPNRIKYDYEIWEYDLQENDYIKEKGNCSLFRDYFPNNLNFLDCLKDKIEILEEYKPIIEKLYIGKNDITYDDGAIDADELVDNFIDVKDKLNEVIDYINRKENK